MIRFALLLCLLASGALADPVREATRPCRVERMDQTYAACVDLISDGHAMAMEARIGQVLSGLQAPTQPELAALEARYEEAQRLWAARVRQACGDSFASAPRARADCRLAAVLQRRDQVLLSLARAADDLGGSVPFDIPVPDAVEVLVPLPGSPNGPRHRVRVPLTVPASP